MKIVVASLNPVKVGAVRTAFETQFEASDLEMIPVSVSSDVSDQPMSDEETRTGARNRVINAKTKVPEADFWVGLEGGLETLDGSLMAFAWMAISNDSGLMGESRTTTLPLPPKIQKLVSEGLELGEANDQVFATVTSKQGGGAYGLLTNGLYTRESVYTQAVVLALVPFVHELWR